MEIKKDEPLAREEIRQERRPLSAMSMNSVDGVPLAMPMYNSNNGNDVEASNVPLNTDNHFNDLLAQTANLMAVNEQLRKEIAENEHIHSMQMRAMNNLPPTGPMAPHHHHHAASVIDMRRRGERRMQKPESYKTVICQAWLESKTCTFAENCRFAHGEEELRPSVIEPRQNNKYKTKLCDKYTTTGLCPYGKRCLFIHPDHGPNAYIRADKLFEVSQRHALADLRDQMENQIMSGGRSAPQTAPEMLARPSTPVEPAVQIPSVPLGPTPVSARGPRYELPSRASLPLDVAGSLPPPSWPLEPSSFFSLENVNLTSRPVSPFESALLGAAATAGVIPFTMMGKQSTPGGVSGYASGGSTPYQDIETSPLSPDSATVAAFLAATNAGKSSLLPLSTVDPSMFAHPREEAFSPNPGFDRLAEDMAKHLELW